MCKGSIVSEEVKKTFLKVSSKLVSTNISGLPLLHTEVGLSARRLGYAL